jgi:origin recognition complex subunit 2
MPVSPAKRTRAASNAGASAGESRSKSQIIVVSSTPTRRRGTKLRKEAESAIRTAPSLRTPGGSASRGHASFRSAASEPNGSYEDTESNEDGDEMEENDDLPIETGDPSKQYRATIKLPELVDGATIRRTTSDVYFHLNSKPARTSSNVYSSLLPQLSPEDCGALTSSSSSHIKKKHYKFLAALHQQSEPNYARWEFELGQGFNLLLYGYGSKLNVVNDFARRRCSRNGHVVIVNGFWSPALSMRNILDAIYQSLPEIGRDTEASSPPGGIEVQTQRIYRYFALPALSTSRDPVNHSHRLFLVIHSIDHSVQLRAPRARACLALLASNPRIHIIASIDNIHSGIMWTSGEMLGRTHGHADDIGDQVIGSGNTNNNDADSSISALSAYRIPSSPGFAWLWHELVTFESYDVELSFRDVSVLPRGRGKAMGDLELGVVVSGIEGALINETAAKQVLASVTQKSKRLFELLGRAQLAALDEKENGSSAMGGSLFGMSYDILALRAREEFLAASDGALRALLTEFRDHGLVAQASGSHESGSGKIAEDTLWIPLSRAVLERLLDGLIK